MMAKAVFLSLVSILISGLCVAEDVIIGNRDFIHLEKNNGVWIFVNANQQPFISLGMNHIGPQFLLQDHNRQHSLDTYGADFLDENGHWTPSGEATKSWVAQVVRDFTNYGFNTIPHHHHTRIPVELYNKKLYWMGKIPTAHASLSLLRKGERFPDVFAPEWDAHMKSAITRYCSQHRNDPNMLGYSYSDIPEFQLKTWLVKDADKGLVNPWVKDLRRLSADAPGKREWINVLKQHHNDAGRADEVYGLEAESWTELAEITEYPPVPADKDAAAKDSYELMSRICETWYSTYHSYIQAVDPNHLILGDKLMARLDNTPDYLFDALGKYVDVVDVMYYGHFDERQRGKLEEFHLRTGKPVLNGDAGFAVKLETMNDVKGIQVASLEEMGQAYAQYLKELMGLPYMIGWHHCGYMESWRGHTDQTGKQQGGFFDPFGKPHEEALRRVKPANAMAIQWHENAEPID
jgi:hypothetical protein